MKIKRFIEYWVLNLKYRLEKVPCDKCQKEIREYKGYWSTPWNLAHFHCEKCFNENKEN